ncbi:MAG: DegT/DnrJ/EryC1/StrS family aminotransferase [Verrucomicrobia bacterium]|nr:DegT/DnrJ/EryC1/StrS family aminotransferase [Verrucomicrobiota bacterium]MBU1735752.1 DegT/DnrJ/EryC1/StrS family aminotransferase [Verrucomicrobiota bacterium]MBU1855805.1 DegT/DnrJ/EryC1/StrS family aminotransferase [Verrucomicrobiota bacterium]
MNTRAKNRLAIAGGKPVRTKPFPIKWPVIGKEERQNLLSVFDSGKWWYGEKVAEFEKKYAAFQNAKYGVSCTNGTVAIEIALLACGIGAGDEVIVPPYTFMATASAVLKVNAIPVFADIDLNTGNLDPKAAAKAITAKTKAIMPVHFAGLPVDVDAFKALARKHKLRLIEDACHSWGSQWKGKGTGALGDCGVFSFQMSKNITAGEGGILLTDNEKIADAARSYSNCGRGKGKAFYEHYLLGSNLRMTELQAAILLGQLTRLKEQTIKRQKNAVLLDKGLKNIPGIALLKNDPRVTRRSYHLYIFRFVTEAWGGVSRETFLNALKAEGISVWSGYPIPLYKNPLFQKSGKGPRYCPLSCPYYGKKIDYTRVSCPNSERICKEACWIVQKDLLAEPSDMQDIIAAVAKVWEHRKELRHE